MGYKRRGRLVLMYGKCVPGWPTIGIVLQGDDYKMLRLCLWWFHVIIEIKRGTK